MAEVKEYSGWWWLPENPKKKIPGILKIEEDKRITLQLLNPLKNEIDNSDVEKDLYNEKSFPVIFGLIENNRTPITLIDSEKYEGSSNHTFWIPTFFKDCQFVENPLLKLVYINFSNLNNWANIKPSRFKDSENRFEMDKTPLPPIGIEIDDDITVELDFSFKNQYNWIEDRYTMGEIVLLKISSKNGLPFTEMRTKILFHLQNFFTLAIGKPSKITSLEGGFENSDDTLFEINTIHGYRPKEVVSVTSSRMLFSLKTIQHEFPQILKKFIDESNKNAGSDIHYFSVMNNPNLYSETKFLSYVQGIEGMYNKYYTQKEGQEVLDSLIDKELFESIKNELYKSLLDLKKEFKAITDEELSERSLRFLNILKTNITNSNNYTLKDKIFKILEDYPAEFLNERFGDIDKRKEFIGKIVRMRDILSHGGDRSDKKYDRENLEKHFERLKFILEMCLLKMIGLSPEKRIQIMSATQRNIKLD